MRLLVILLLFMSAFLTTVFGQELSRAQKIEELKKLTAQKEKLRERLDQIEERSDELAGSMFEIDEADKIEAEKYNAKAVRLFPDGLMDNLFDSPDSHGFSVYPFTEISDSYFAPKLRFTNNLLKFNDKEYAENHGFIINIGQISLDSVNDQIPALAALEKYKPPVDSKEIKAEFSSDGFQFGIKAAVSVGETYLVRVIKQGGGDGLFALKVHKKDEEGSIVIFLKLIKILRVAPKFEDRPKEPKLIETYPSVLPDQVIYDQCRMQLNNKGFINVQIEVKNSVLTATGIVPQGRLAEAVMLINDCRPLKIINQLTEEK